MIDIHSHILNGIDDGSKSLAMTVNMLRIAENSGTKAIVATPHFMKGRFNTEYNDVLEEIKKLKDIIKEEKINIEVYGGQEVFYTNNILQYYLDKAIGTINNSKYMLIELPMFEFDLDEVVNNLYELRIRNIVSVIAHPERYRQFIKKPYLINKLIDEECLFQVNAGSIAGNFGRDVRKTALLYIENNIYSFIGSDAHRDEGRNTDMTNAIKLISKELKEEFEENSYTLINNGNVEFNGSMLKEKKKFLGIF